MDAEVERLRKKVENYPSPSSYNRLAELLRANGKADDAESICRRSMRDFPRNGQAYVILAGIEAGRNSRDRAKGLLQKAVENDPRCQSAHRQLADLAYTESHLDLAIRHLQTYIDLRPKDADAAKLLTEWQTALQQKQAAAAPSPGSSSGSGGYDRKKHESCVDLSDVVPRLTSNPTIPPPSQNGNGAPPPPPPAGAGGTLQPADVLGNYCQQDGVNCAIIADKLGRCVATKNIPSGMDDLVAALAGEITSCGNESLSCSGAGEITNWNITAEEGQILFFNEHRDLSLIAIADSEIKSAMLELRARQAIFDLGGTA